jgi:hypothetical protein
MAQPTENQIADRSYFIWEKEGRPEGKALDHWLRARTELEAETAAKPKRTRAAAPRKAGTTATKKKTNGKTGVRKTKAKAV